MNKEDNKLPSINNSELDTIVNQIIAEGDVNKLKSLTTNFKAFAAKKEVLRIMKLSELLDKIEDVAIDRFNNSNLITNDQVLEFMKVTQNSIDRANKMLDDINGATNVLGSTVNNLTIINVEDNSPQAIASRERVQKAVYNLLNKAKDLQVIEDEVIINESNEVSSSEKVLDDSNIVEERKVEDTSFKLKQNEGED